MKNRTLLVGMLLLLSSFAAQAHDGQVYVSGTIQANTCIVAPQSQAQSVPLGDIPGKQFSAKGSGSQPVAFVIDLQKCGAAASGVDFTFTGRQTEPIGNCWHWMAPRPPAALVSSCKARITVDYR